MKALKFLFIIALALMISMGAGCSSNVMENSDGRVEDTPVKLAIASMEVGTNFYSYGSLFAEKIRQGLPQGSSVDVLPYGGAIGCVQLVSDGSEADLGLSSIFLLDWASKGIFAYEKGKIENVRILVTGLDTYFLAPIARKDAPFNSLQDIVDKKIKVNVATKKPGSLADYGGMLLLNAYGLTEEKIREFGGKIDKNDQQVISDDMRNGRISLDLDYFSLGHPVISELATQLPIKFLPLEQNIIDDLCSDYGFTPVTLPAGSFQGQDQDVPLVGGSTALIARTDLPDDLAYTITKTIFENAEFFRANHAALKEFSAERSVLFAAGVPFHPGAERYYREIGLID